MIERPNAPTGGPLHAGAIAIAHMPVAHRGDLLGTVLERVPSVALALPRLIDPCRHAVAGAMPRALVRDAHPCELIVSIVVEVVLPSRVPRHRPHAILQVATRAMVGESALACACLDVPLV